MTLSIFIVITLIYSLGLTFLVYKYFVMAFFRRAWFLGFYKYIVESNLSEMPSEVKKLYKRTKDDNRKILTDFNVVATLYVLIYLSCFLFIWIYILLKSTNEIDHEIYVLDGKLFECVKSSTLRTKNTSFLKTVEKGIFLWVLQNDFMKWNKKNLLKAKCFIKNW